MRKKRFFLKNDAKTFFHCRRVVGRAENGGVSMRVAVFGVGACFWAFQACAAPAAIAYYEGAASNASLTAEAGTLGGLAADQFAVDAHGALSGAVPANVFKIATAHGIALFATVSNYGANGFEPGLAKAILSPGAAQTAAISAMAALATHGYVGINLDFESVPYGLRAAYSAFSQSLAASLHKGGYTLMLSLPAKTMDNPTDSWTGAYDYPALAQAADILQVMTYDENGPWGAPGPVAGLDWVTACLQYSLTAAPAAQISLGIPAYGYDWNLTKNTGVQIGYKAVPALIHQTGATVHWNSQYASPWFTYTAANGNRHAVWYENAHSIQRKAALAAGADVASVSVYALGLDNPGFWAALKSGLVAE